MRTVCACATSFAWSGFSHRQGERDCRPQAPTAYRRSRLAAHRPISFRSGVEVSTPACPEIDLPTLHLRSFGPINRRSHAAALFQDASHVSRFPESSIRRAVKAGELVAFKVRGRYRISETDLRDWLSGNSTRTPAAPARRPSMRHEPDPGGVFPDQLLTLEMCASATRTSYGVIRRATQAGALPSGRVESEILVKAEDPRVGAVRLSTETEAAPFFDSRRSETMRRPISRIRVAQPSPIPTICFPGVARAARLFESPAPLMPRSLAQSRLEAAFVTPLGLIPSHAQAVLKAFWASAPAIAPERRRPIPFVILEPANSPILPRNALAATSGFDFHFLQPLVSAAPAISSRASCTS